MKKKKHSGFVLWEFLVSLLILWIIARFVIQKMFRAVEYSRNPEANAILETIKDAMDRCKLRTGAYNKCVSDGTSFALLDIENPGFDPKAHFSYTITSFGSTLGENNYFITARRNTVDGGNPASTMIFRYYPDMGCKERVFTDGYGDFAALGDYADHCDFKKKEKASFFSSSFIKEKIEEKKKGTLLDREVLEKTMEEKIGVTSFVDTMLKEGRKH